MRAKAKEETLAEQISEMRREIADRERTYPQLIADGKLDKTVAEKKLTRMWAALKTLNSKGRSY